MVEFYKEEGEVPKRRYSFVPSDETLEIKAILDDMDVGQKIRFPVSENQSVKEFVRIRNRFISRINSAIKRVNNGFYKAYIRDKDVWVERLE